MKVFYLVSIIFLLQTPCFSQLSPLELEQLKPGSYDNSWWNREPLRLIQTNLREIDANLDREKYVQSMVDASANLVLLNVGGIVANYPTELPFQYRNTFMEGDLVGDLVHQLHEKEIKVIGRFDFSKINESLAEKKPEWLYKSRTGETVSFNEQTHTCVNGGYQQEYSLEILTEAIEKYPLDGIFFNMIGYQTRDYAGEDHGICQCDNCKKGFKEMSGKELPQEVSPGEPLYAEYNEFKRQTSEKLFTKISEHIKTLDPSLMIKTYTDVGVDMISSESGASLSSDYEWNYHATDNVKRVLGSYQDRSPMNLLIYFQAIGFRHVGTSPDLARVWMLENMLHGAPLGFVVIGPLFDYEERAFIPYLEDYYGFHKQHENLFTNLESSSKLALIRGAGQEYRGMIKLLTELHIPYDIIEPGAILSGRLPRALNDYEVLVLGDVSNMGEGLVESIDEYVEKGGKILATGFTSSTKRGEGGGISLKSLGVDSQFKVYPQAKSTYLRVGEQDKAAIGNKLTEDFSLMMVYADFLDCSPIENTESYMQLIPETMFGPPEKSYFTEEEVTDIPGLFSNTYGQGKASFIPWQLGAQYYHKGNYAHKALFYGALSNLLEWESDLQTNASHLVEISRMKNRDGAFEWLGLINHSGQIGGTIGKPIPMRDIEIRFKPAKPLEHLYLLRSGQTLDFEQDGDWVLCTVPHLEDFEMVVGTYN
ncbi:alpha-amylase family protein [Pleomorphovibrio marinus]|uniref:alpha-amylase family protein n=1 Tax=Pleomorphovibrio marinus TaxID=2164132 RepID=UPI000E0AA22B|nr:alpha-amylase family protein [Pleomorphovibrio marinus]